MCLIEAVSMSVVDQYEMNLDESYVHAKFYARVTSLYSIVIISYAAACKKTDSNHRILLRRRRDVLMQLRTDVYQGPGRGYLRVDGYP